MIEVEKEYAGDSGANWICDLDGPDGNVYALWNILKTFGDLYGWGGEEMIEESMKGGHYDDPSKCPYVGYDRVLDYVIHNLSPSPAAVSFRMYGEEIHSVADYQLALENP